MIKIQAGIDLSMNSIGLTIVVIDTEKEGTTFIGEKEKTPTGKEKKGAVEFTYKIPYIIDESYIQIISEEPKGHKGYSPSVNVTHYQRNFSNENYSVSEMNKILSASRLASKIKEIIKKFMDKYETEFAEVRMEGSVMSFGFRTGKMNDLTAFNAITKMMLVNSKEFNVIHIIPPTSLKKYATGKGNSKKEKMIESFLKLRPDFVKQGKIDDVVDAWFLATVDLDESESYKK